MNCVLGVWAVLLVFAFTWHFLRFLNFSILGFGYGLSGEYRGLSDSLISSGRPMLRVSVCVCVASSACCVCVRYADACLYV